MVQREFHETKGPCELRLQLQMKNQTYYKSSSVDDTLLLNEIRCAAHCTRSHISLRQPSIPDGSLTSDKLALRSKDVVDQQVGRETKLSHKNNVTVLKVAHHIDVLSSTHAVHVLL